MVRDAPAELLAELFCQETNVSHLVFEPVHNVDDEHTISCWYRVMANNVRAHIRPHQWVMQVLVP